MPIRHPLVLPTLVALLVLPGRAGGQAPAPDRAAERALRRTPVVEVFQQARDAVVNISSTEIVAVRRPSGFDRLFEDMFDLPPRPREYRRTSVGSGFVIHPDGYIVTNAHVVARTTERKVTFADGRVFDAEIVALDRSRDLAILKIAADESLPTLPLGRSDDLMIGETVIAIGNPFGFEHTVTAGVVSAVGRELEFPELVLAGLIQTDASINPGNSGGPLLNVLGQLIGVASAIRGDAENIGFAIPVDQLREVLPELLDVERRYRVESGLTISNYDAPRVLAVEPGSPAAESDLRPGDVIEQVDGRPVTEGIDFHIALVGRRPGDRLDLAVRRGEERRRATLALAARPLPDGQALARRRLGLEVHPMPEESARELGLPPGSGLIVVEVEPDGPAARTGLRRRDIVVGLGRHHVHSVEELGLFLEAVDPDAALPVTILRVDRRGKYQLGGSIRVR
jgi:serine protease Do